jgi:hypothetical protein
MLYVSTCWALMLLLYALNSFHILDQRNRYEQDML